MRKLRSRQRLRHRPCLPLHPVPGAHHPRIRKSSASRQWGSRPAAGTSLAGEVDRNSGEWLTIHGHLTGNIDLRKRRDTDLGRRASVLQHERGRLPVLRQAEPGHHPVPRTNRPGTPRLHGNLVDLRANQGDFSISTDECLGDNLGVTAVTDPDIPDIGGGYWYLVRVVYSSSGYVGSYDVQGTGTLRDDGISASPLGCP